MRWMLRLVASKRAGQRLACSPCIQVRALLRVNGDRVNGMRLFDAGAHAKRGSRIEKVLRFEEKFSFRPSRNFQHRRRCHVALSSAFSTASQVSNEMREMR